MNHSLLDWPSGVSTYRPEKCFNGYTLVHGRGRWDPVRDEHGVTQEPHWHLIDMSGRVVHRWYGDPIRRAGTQLFEMLANGNVISNGANVTEQDWELILPYLQENERLFGICIEDLLTVYGVNRTFEQVYRKVRPVRLSVLVGMIEDSED